MTASEIAMVGPTQAGVAATCSRARVSSMVGSSWQSVASMPRPREIQRGPASAPQPPRSRLTRSPGLVSFGHASSFSRPRRPPAARHHASRRQQERRAADSRRHRSRRRADGAREHPAHPGRRDDARAAGRSRRASAEWTGPNAVRVDARRLRPKPLDPGALRPHSRVDSARRSAARPLRLGDPAAARRRRHRPAPGRYPLPGAGAARRLGHGGRSLRARGRRVSPGATSSSTSPASPGPRTRSWRRSQAKGRTDPAQRRLRAARAGPRPGAGGDGRADRGHRLQHLYDRGRAAAARRRATPSAPITSRSAASSASPRSPTARSRSIRSGPRICAARCSGFERLGIRPRVEGTAAHRRRRPGAAHPPRPRRARAQARGRALAGVPRRRHVHHHRHARRNAPGCCWSSRRCSSRGSSSWTS